MFPCGGGSTGLGAQGPGAAVRAPLLAAMALTRSALAPAALSFPSPLQVGLPPLWLVSVSTRRLRAQGGSCLHHEEGESIFWELVVQIQTISCMSNEHIQALFPGLGQKETQSLPLQSFPLGQGETFPVSLGQWVPRTP